MENERKEYKEKKPFDKQIFYFNDKGQLVVESNKGVWVDGEKFVKMYGDFVCNAKTMGEIIHQLKGIAVEVGETRYVHDDNVEYGFYGVSFEDKYVISNSRCVLGASKERIEEYEKEFAKQEFVSKEIEELQKQIGEDGDKIYELKKSIEKFNKLPWWKRMFKKIEVK
jgi:hypothetical protein